MRSTNPKEDDAYHKFMLKLGEGLERLSQNPVLILVSLLVGAFLIGQILSLPISPYQICLDKAGTGINHNLVRANYDWLAARLGRRVDVQCWASIENKGWKNNADVYTPTCPITQYNFYNFTIAESGKRS